MASTWSQRPASRAASARISIKLTMPAEPMPFDGERLVDSGFGRLITMEK